MQQKRAEVVSVSCELLLIWSWQIMEPFPLLVVTLLALCITPSAGELNLNVRLPNISLYV